ncbi:MAG: hypothetical protein II917_10605 [Synergistaceae bacterium]|nr:hypothetical protein [Synergistaceae bacterium]
MEELGCKQSNYNGNKKVCRKACRKVYRRVCGRVYRKDAMKKNLILQNVCVLWASPMSRFKLPQSFHLKR